MPGLISGELLRILRQPMVLFWGFLFVPAFALLIRFLLEGFVYVRSGQFAAPTTDLALSAAATLSFSGNAMAHLLYAIGIGAVFVSEYRHATWRLLVPRSRRLPLLGAKVVTCMLLIGFGILLAVLGDMLLSVAFAVLSGRGVGLLTLTASGLATLVGSALLSLAELTILTLLVGGLTIITRSLIAPVIAAFALAMGSSMLQLYLGADATQLPLASYAAETVRDSLLGTAVASPVLNGMLVLAAWLVGLALAIGLVFRWQELATE